MSPYIKYKNKEYPWHRLSINPHNNSVAKSYSQHLVKSSYTKVLVKLLWRYFLHTLNTTISKGKLEAPYAEGIITVSDLTQESYLMALTTSQRFLWKYPITSKSQHMQDQIHISPSKLSLFLLAFPFQFTTPFPPSLPNWNYQNHFSFIFHILCSPCPSTSPIHSIASKPHIHLPKASPKFQPWSAPS